MLSKTSLLLCGTMVTTVVLVGCEQPLKQSEIKFLETRQLALSYDDSFKAATNGIFSLGFTVDHSDKQSGVLTGKRRDPQTGKKIANAVFFGVVGMLATGEREEAVSLMLTSVAPKLTDLRMKLMVNGKSIVDRNIMTQVWQQIEREAMLDSGPSATQPASAPLQSLAPEPAPEKQS